MRPNPFRIFASDYPNLLAVLLLSLLALAPAKEASARSVGDPCSLGFECDAGLSCQPGVHRCYPEERQAGQPCSLGFDCAAGLTCEAGTQVCVAPAQHGGACHATRICDGGLSCQPGVHKCFNEPRTVGEPCSAGFDCSAGLSCVPGAQRCFPTELVYDDDTSCFAIYDEATAKLADDSDVTTTYGYGFSVTMMSPSGGAEVGVVYGKGGRYGCYQSSCAGFTQGDLAVGGAITIGQYTSFDAVAGKSIVTAAGGSFPVFEVGASVSMVQSDEDGTHGEPVGSVQSLSLGIGLNPFTAQTMKCTTEVNEIDIYAKKVELGLIAPRWFLNPAMFPTSQYDSRALDAICQGWCATFKRQWTGKRVMQNMGETPGLGERRLMLCQCIEPPK